MAERLRADALLAWALGAFHTATLMVVLVAYTHAGGGLANTFLAGPGSAAGLAAFALLWLATSWTTRRALRGYSIDPGKASPLLTTASHGVLWAGANGVLFFLALVLGLGLSEVGSGGNSGFGPGTAPALLFYVGLGTGAAFVVGAVIGLAFVVVDLAVIGLGLWIARWCLAEPDRGRSGPDARTLDAGSSPHV